MIPGTYTEAQYSTPAARAMIRQWLGHGPDRDDIERVARYLSTTLRVGPMRVVRPIVVAAAEEWTLDAEMIPGIGYCGPDWQEAERLRKMGRA